MTWEAGGTTHSQSVAGLDRSPSGIGARSLTRFDPGTSVYVQGDDGSPCGYATVRHCTAVNGHYVVGFELDPATRGTAASPPDEVDYYEFLQISSNAELSTIQRVHRFLAGRYHPDNPETGDTEKFVLLNRAWQVLSDPQLRAAYDAERLKKQAGPGAAFRSIDFMDGIEGEVNRRLAVLSVLYNRRRTNPDNPHVSLAELEAKMDFPRDYLDFTTWYLKSKRYIIKEDNSDFSLTAEGVDYVEANYAETPLLRELLLNAGVARSGSASRQEKPDQGRHRIFMLKSAESPDERTN